MDHDAGTRLEQAPRKRQPDSPTRAADKGDPAREIEQVHEATALWDLWEPLKTGVATFHLISKGATGVAITGRSPSRDETRPSMAACGPLMASGVSLHVRSPRAWRRIAVLGPHGRHRDRGVAHREA